MAASRQQLWKCAGSYGCGCSDNLGFWKRCNRCGRSDTDKRFYDKAASPTSRGFALRDFWPKPGEQVDQQRDRSKRSRRNRRQPEAGSSSAPAATHTSPSLDSCIKGIAGAGFEAQAAELQKLMASQKQAKVAELPLDGQLKRWQGTSTSLRKLIADKTTKAESLRKRAKEAQDVVDQNDREILALQSELSAATDKCVALAKETAGLPPALEASFPVLQLHPGLLELPGILQIKQTFDGHLATLVAFQKNAQQQVETLISQHQAASNAAASNHPAPGAQQQAADIPAGDDSMDGDEVTEDILGQFLKATEGLPVDKRDLLGAWTLVAKRRKKVG